MLIDAVRTLVSEGHILEVEIAGVGPLLGDLEQQARGLPITFIGPVDLGEPVADFLRSLDVFVLPSTHREARPVVVLEAQCCGVAVVATDIPGMVETTGGAALLVAPDDSSSLARGISTALDDAGAGERSLRAAEAILSFDQVAERYAMVFEDVIRGRRSPAGT